MRMSLVLAPLFSLFLSYAYGNGVPSWCEDNGNGNSNGCGVEAWKCKDGERDSSMLMPYLKNDQDNADKPNIISKFHTPLSDT